MMRKTHIFFVAIMVLAVLSFANAGITQVNCADDNDGAIVMSPFTWTDLTGGEYEMSMNCVQDWTPGHVIGDFNTVDDPSVKIMQSITNDTGFSWTGYELYIAMDHSFTISTASADTLRPTNWTFAVTQPTYGPTTLPIVGGNAWVGLVKFSIGTGSSIPDGNDGDFGAKITWTGTGIMHFCTEQIPTPEPATIALLGLGGLALLRKRK